MVKVSGLLSLNEQFTLHSTSNNPNMLEPKLGNAGTAYSRIKNYISSTGLGFNSYQELGLPKAS